MNRLVFPIVIAVFLSGCVTNQTGGAVVGGATGAAIGSMFGGGSGRLVGTGVGAVLGTMVGSTVGASLDREEGTAYAPRRFGSAGEESAYNRGRAEREEEIQALREQRAYEKGRRGY